MTLKKYADDNRFSLWLYLKALWYCMSKPGAGEKEWARGIESQLFSDGIGRMLREIGKCGTSAKYVFTYHGLLAQLYQRTEWAKKDSNKLWGIAAQNSNGTISLLCHMGMLRIGHCQPENEQNWDNIIRKAIRRDLSELKSVWEKIRLQGEDYEIGAFSYIEDEDKWNGLELNEIAGLLSYEFY